MRAIAPCRATLINDGKVEAVLDVGANAGQYGTDLRDWGYGGRILSFEPGSEAFGRLSRRAAEDDLWDCLPIGLGREQDRRELFIAGNAGQSSSLLEMSDLHIDAAPDSAIVGSETVEIETLDRVAGQLLDREARLYTKLDVQGLELDVLAGGRGLLERTVALELELSLVPLYREMPLIGDVVEALRAWGFVLFSVEPDWKAVGTGELSQLNGLFRRIPTSPA